MDFNPSTRMEVLARCSHSVCSLSLRHHGEDGDIVLLQGAATLIALGPEQRVPLVLLGDSETLLRTEFVRYNTQCVFSTLDGESFTRARLSERLSEPARLMASPTSEESDETATWSRIHAQPFVPAGAPPWLLPLPIHEKLGADHGPGETHWVICPPLFETVGHGSSLRWLAVQAHPVKAISPADPTSVLYTFDPLDFQEAPAPCTVPYGGSLPPGCPLVRRRGEDCELVALHRGHRRCKGEGPHVLEHQVGTRVTLGVVQELMSRYPPTSLSDPWGDLEPWKLPQHASQLKADVLLAKVEACLLAAAASRVTLRVDDSDLAAQLAYRSECMGPHALNALLRRQPGVLIQKYGRCSIGCLGVRALSVEALENLGNSGLCDVLTEGISRSYRDEAALTFVGWAAGLLARANVNAERLGTFGERLCACIELYADSVYAGTLSPELVTWAAYAFANISRAPASAFKLIRAGVLDVWRLCLVGDARLRGDADFLHVLLLSLLEMKRRMNSTKSAGYTADRIKCKKRFDEGVNGVLNLLDTEQDSTIQALCQQVR